MAKRDHAKKVKEMSEWSDDELRMLDKAVKKFPMGTPRRWEQVSSRRQLHHRSVTFVTSGTVAPRLQLKFLNWLPETWCEDPHHLKLRSRGSLEELLLYLLHLWGSRLLSKAAPQKQITLG